MEQEIYSDKQIIIIIIKTIIKINSIVKEVKNKASDDTALGKCCFCYDLYCDSHKNRTQKEQKQQLNLYVTTCTEKNMKKINTIYVHLVFAL